MVKRSSWTGCACVAGTCPPGGRNRSKASNWPSVSTPLWRTTIRSPLIGLSMTCPPAMGEPYCNDPDHAGIVLSQVCRRYHEQRPSELKERHEQDSLGCAEYRQNWPEPRYSGHATGHL